MNTLVQLDEVMSAQKICRVLPSPHVQTKTPTSAGLTSSMLVQPVAFLAKVDCRVIVQVILPALPSYHVLKTAMVMLLCLQPFAENHSKMLLKTAPNHAAHQTIALVEKRVSHSLPVLPAKQIIPLSLSTVAQHLRRHP